MSIPSILSVAGRAGAKSVPRFLAVACAAALLFSAGTRQAEADFLMPLSTFGTAGPQTVGDKTYTYISSSGTWNPATVDVSGVDVGPYHLFDINNLAAYTGSVFTLDYRVTVNPAAVLAGIRIDTIALDSDHLLDGTVVTKEVWNYASGTGSPTLLTLTSVNGTAQGFTPLSSLATDIWVRDTIDLTGGGRLGAVSNSIHQIPEIDVASMAGAFPLLVAGLALLERRRGARAGRTSPAAG